MRPFTLQSARRAFTLTELLVAIGIIALLIGILLPALNAVSQRSKRTATTALMQQFASACEHFQQQLGFLPGIVPEDVLAYDTAQSGNIAKISGTENALLHLMGGAVRADDVTASEWAALTPANGWVTLSFQRPQGGSLEIKVNVREMTTGRGPRIGGNQYERFFTPKGSELVDVQGQAGPAIDFDPLEPGTQGIPDLVDAWGQPILYLRAARGTGPLAGDVIGSGNNAPAQFGLYSISPYIASSSLGALGRDQTATAALGGSMFNRATGTESGSGTNAFHVFLAQVVRHAGMGNPSQPVNTGVARGRFVLISAGKDGIYFSTRDGPGTPSVPVTNIITSDFTNGGNFGPAVVDTYDDIRIFGGS